MKRKIRKKRKNELKINVRVFIYDLKGLGNVYIFYRWSFSSKARRTSAVDKNMKTVCCGPRVATSVFQVLKLKHGSHSGLFRLTVFFFLSFLFFSQVPVKDNQTHCVYFFSGNFHTFLYLSLSFPKKVCCLTQDVGDVRPKSGGLKAFICPDSLLSSCTLKAQQNFCSTVWITNSYFFKSLPFFT